jgi:hypothetical protein
MRFFRSYHVEDMARSSASSNERHGARVNCFVKQAPDSPHCCSRGGPAPMP